jgi:hypothetical protein
MLVEKSVYTVFKTLLSKKKRHEIVKNLIADTGFTLDTWKEIYGLVRTEDGYKTFVKWFNDTFKVQTKPNEDEFLSSSISSKTIQVVLEDIFVLFFENIAKWQEYKILDLYDIMSAKDGYVDIELLYIFVCLMIAKESHCLNAFMSQFSDHVYSFLGANYRNISYFLEIDDILVTNAVNKLCLKPKVSSLTIDDFVILYYYVFKSIDKNYQ